jgi:hypothetical protein
MHYELRICGIYKLSEIRKLTKFILVYKIEKFLFLLIDSNYIEKDEEDGGTDNY